VTVITLVGAGKQFRSFQTLFPKRPFFLKKAPFKLSEKLMAFVTGYFRETSMPNSTEIRFGAMSRVVCDLWDWQIFQLALPSRKTNNLPSEQLRQRRNESSMNRKGVSFPSDDETRTRNLFAVRQIAYLADLRRTARKR
jgi:hypothetical protein